MDSINFAGLQIKIINILCCFLIFLLLIEVLLQRWKNRRVNKFMNTIPGPTSFPIIGSAYLLIGVTTQNLCGRLKTIIKNYPGLCAYWDGNQPHIITGNREIFNAVLSSSQNTDKFRHYEHFKAISKGIFSSSGQEWRAMRKMINPSFRANVLTSFDENFRYHTNIFVNLLRRHENSGPFDIFLPVHLCTIDLIFDNMMKSRVDVQKNNFTYLSSNLITISEMVFERAFAPLLWPDWIYRLSGMQNLFDKLLSEEKSFLQVMLERRIATREAKKLCFPHEKLQTFIEIMLRNLDSGSISKDRVLSEMTEMFIAGSISTAITNAWVFKMLAMFPAIQDKAYQEIIENCDGAEVTPENLSNLFYLEMIIKETLRHFTIPVMGRRITEDLQVNEELIIPAGIQVFLCTYALHHETVYWQKPGEFYPEHFSSENEANRPKGAFVPFLSGPRGCPGHHYAMKSIKFIVANTILKYHFSTDEKPPKDMRDLDYRLVFMIWPAAGFEVKIKRR